MNLMKLQRPDVDKICLFIKVPFESKYQLLINERGIIEIPKAFMDYWQTIDDIYESLESYTPTKKRKQSLMIW